MLHEIGDEPCLAPLVFVLSNSTPHHDWDGPGELMLTGICKFYFPSVFVTWVGMYEGYTTEVLLVFDRNLGRCRQCKKSWTVPKGCNLMLRLQF